MLYNFQKVIILLIQVFGGNTDMSMEDHEEAQRRFEEVYRFMKNNYGWDSDDWRKFHDFLPDEFGNRRNSLDYNELKQAAIDFHDG